MRAPFTIGITPDFVNPDGTSIWPGLRDTLRERFPAVQVAYLSERTPAVTPAQLEPLDAIVAFGVRFTRESFAGAGRLVLLARYGVGYDAVDVDACTGAGVMLTLTRGMAQRPVAEAALTMMLALGHHLREKDRMTREGRWHDRGYFNGIELRDRVIGIVGLGEIGRELARLLVPFGVRRIVAFDPYANPHAAQQLGVELVPLDDLLRDSDFVSVHCPLSEETCGLIAERELALMRPRAYIVNTARGPIIDQPALTRALQERRIGGAGLDVFAEEPVSPDEPLLTLDNVLLAPHSLAWTEELFRDYTESIFAAVRAVMEGRVPEHVVNRDVLEREALKEKLARAAERARGG